MTRAGLSPLEILLAVTVPVIWGMGFVFAKAALETIPPILLMALRFSLTALVLVWFVRPPWGWMWRVFWIATVGGAIQYALIFTGLKHLDVSTHIFIVQCEGPMIAAVAFLMLGERCNWPQIAGMALALGGVVLIGGAPEVRAQLGAFAMTVVGALLWSTGQVMTRKLHADGARLGGFALIAWVCVFGAPQLFLASAVMETGQLRALAEAGWVEWGAVLYMGLIMTALGYAVWYRLLSRHPAGRVSAFLMLIPVTTVAGGVLLLGETVPAQVALGGVIVVAGVAFTVFEPRRRTAAGRDAAEPPSCSPRDQGGR